MNKKYKELSKKSFNEENPNIKDYNVIADSIMSLTGSYINKKTFVLKSRHKIKSDFSENFSLVGLRRKFFCYKIRNFAFR